MSKEVRIIGETVYVVYQKGVPYSAPGVSIVYTEERLAKGCITKESKKIAEERYNERHKKDFKDWYDASPDMKEAYITAARHEFEVREYGPKGK
ncbi:hypothetical protein ACQKJG_18195 [Priestia megaterium]|uniref:hypothetical protein n=1 Tax=Priestia megaterium TaxID=1404 RepID=UPI003CFD92A2